MREIQKPRFLIVVTSLVIMFLAFTGLALSAFLSTAPFLPFWLKLVIITMQALLITLSVLQCVLYLKSYTDYRISKIELENKSVKSA